MPRVYNDNGTRTTPTSVCRPDGFHRELRTEVEKERGSEIEQGNGRGGVTKTRADQKVGPASLQVYHLPLGLFFGDSTCNSKRNNGKKSICNRVYLFLWNITFCG